MDIAEVLMATAQMPRADAALVFAAAGFPVFPCVPGHKRPMVRSGFHDATTDADRIEDWWRRWPNANIGMPTGPRSGIDVVDIDIRPTGSGFTAFRRALDADLASGEIARVRTPSGGMHVYYPADAAQPCWQAAMAHVDFRGDGGYILIPPSEVETAAGRGRYHAFSLSSAGAHPVDAQALRRFVDPRPIPTRIASPRGQVEPAAIADWVARLREGERNRGLFWAACRLFEAGMPPAFALDVLSRAAGKAGLEQNEITTTLRSAWRRTHQPAPSPAMVMARSTIRERGRSCQR